MQVSVMSTKKGIIDRSFSQLLYLMKGYYGAKGVSPLARGQIHFWYARSWCCESKRGIGKIKKMGSVYDDELENRETPQGPATQPNRPPQKHSRN